jgi:hypothetical protein
MMEDWPLLEADADLHLVGEGVQLLPWESFLLVLDHGLEVDVNLDALELVVGLSFTLELADLLHLKPTCISIYFYLIDFISSRHFSLQVPSLGCHQRSVGHVQVGHRALRNARLRLRLYAELLLEAILPLLRRAVSGQALVFELVQHGLGRHLIDLVLFLQVLKFLSLHSSLCNYSNYTLINQFKCISFS